MKGKGSRFSSEDMAVEVERLDVGPLTEEKQNESLREKDQLIE